MSEVVRTLLAAKTSDHRRRTTQPGNVDVALIWSLVRNGEMDDIVGDQAMPTEIESDHAAKTSSCDLEPYALVVKGFRSGLLEFSFTRPARQVILEYFCRSAARFN